MTGTSSGLGSAIAQELANRGFTVGCLSRRGGIPSSQKGSIVPYSGDVQDKDVVAAALSDFAGRAGGICGLVNNAGRHEALKSSEMTADQLRAIMELNFIAVFECCRMAYPYLQKSKGLIVNMGSLFDKLGVPGSLAYSASKSAVASLTRTLAVEWAKDEISVVALAPGYVRTGLNEDAFSDPTLVARIEGRIPLRRMGAIAEVARFTASLFVERIGFLTGETIYIDGGHGIGP